MFFVLEVVLWSCPWVFIIVLVLCSLILFLELFVFGPWYCYRFFFIVKFKACSLPPVVLCSCSLFLNLFSVLDIVECDDLFFVLYFCVCYLFLVFVLWSWKLFFVIDVCSLGVFFRYNCPCSLNFDFDSWTCFVWSLVLLVVLRHRTFCSSFLF